MAIDFGISLYRLLFWTAFHPICIVSDCPTDSSAMLIKSQVFNPSEIFRILYRDSCVIGIQDFARVQQLSVDLICADIESKMISMFSYLKHDGQTAAALRQDDLKRSSEHWQERTFTTTCLICLQRYSEHRMECGHGICDVCICIPQFGRRAKGLEYHYEINLCPLCQTEICFQAKLVPPTCRARFLGMDGGGARGIVIFGFMEELERSMGLPYPVQDNFDYSIGSSSGKIVLVCTAVTLILTRWRCKYRALWKTLESIPVSYLFPQICETHIPGERDSQVALRKVITFLALSRGR